MLNSNSPVLAPSRSATAVLLAAFWLAPGLVLAQAPSAAAAPSAWRTSSAKDSTRLVVTLQPAAQAALLSGARWRAADLLDGERARASGLSVVKTLGSGHLVLGGSHTALNRTSAKALAAELEKDPRVAAVELDVRVRPAASPASEPLAAKQWALQPVASHRGSANLNALWHVTLGKGAVIAVLDSGILPHPELQGQIAGEHDFISDASLGGDGNGRDRNGTDEGDFCIEGEHFSPSSWHGTLVSGLAVGRWDGAGMGGVLPQAKVLNARVLGRCGGWLTDVADAVRWAAGAPIPHVPAHHLNVQVLNLSLGSEPGVPCPSYMQSAVSAARERGALVVVAAGNEAAPILGSPANCSGVLAVAAHTNSADLTDYTNDDPRIAVSGPAGGACRFQALAACNSAPLVSAHNTGERTAGTHGYAYAVGTSVAAPHVSAVLAALKLRLPGLSAEQARALLQNHSRPFGSDSACANKACGYGMLDAGLLMQGIGEALTPGVQVRVEPAWPRRGERVSLKLSALLSGTADPEATVIWSQLSGTPIKVEASGLDAFFDAPQVTGDIQLRATVTFGTGAQQQADVSARVVAGTAPRFAPTTTAFTISEGQSWTWAPEVWDDENNFSELVLLQGPTGMVARDKTLVWSRPLRGHHVVQVVALDAEGLRSAEKTLTLTVERASKSDSGAGSGGKGAGQAGGLLALLLVWGLAIRWSAARCSHEGGAL